MTKNESKIIKEAIIIIISHIKRDGDLSSFTYSERKRLENIKKKLSKEVNADETKRNKFKENK